MRMSLKTKTTRRDFGANRIRQINKKLLAKNAPYVKSGFPSEKKESKKKYKIGKTVLDVAVAHEYGLDGLPERSFMRSTFLKEKRKYSALSARLVNRIIRKKESVPGALEKMGLLMVKDIKNFIRRRKVRPKSYRAVREGGTTLYDTGQLINSLTHRVENAKGFKKL